MVLGAALLVIAMGGGAYLMAGRYHIDDVWVYLGEISLVFFVTIGLDCRREFRSVRFVIFFGCWLLAHLAIFVFVVAYLGWLYWLLAFSVELFLFYATTSRPFGLQSPLRRRR